MLPGGDDGPNRLREERGRLRQEQRSEEERVEAKQRQMREEETARKERGGLWSPSGAPSPNSSETSPPSTTVGDGGRAWRARAQRNEDSRDRLGFRRPDSEAPLVRPSSSSPSPLSSALSGSSSPDSAASASSGGTKRSWRERVKERRGDTEGEVARTAGTPPPSVALTEAERTLERQRSLQMRSRFAGLEGDGAALPPLAEEPSNSAESLPPFIPQAIRLDDSASAPPPAMTVAERTAQINRLAAKAMKAKLMNRTTEYEQLQTEIAELKAATSAFPPASSSLPSPAVQVVPSPTEHDHVHNGVVILSELDAHDRPISLPSSTTLPSSSSSSLSSHSSRKRKSHVEKMVGGERVAYRDDDVADNKSVLQMIEEERLHRDDEDSRYDDVYARNVVKKGKFAIANPDDLFDSLDSTLGLYQSKRGALTQQQQMERQKQMQRKESERYDDLINTCELCVSSSAFSPSTLISTGVKLMLTLPRRGVVSEGHCLLSTIDHSIASSEWDEGAREELLYWKRHLQSMYAASPTSPHHLVTVETVIHRRRRRHTFLHCLELTAEEFADAPIVFSQAIKEAEGDWATHRPLIEVKAGMQGGVQRVIPAGFPYFVVEFGGEGGGYAHVIEEEGKWEEEFGLEVIRGLKGVISRGGKRGAGGREARDVEAARVGRFRARWKAFDWTHKTRAPPTTKPA